MQTNISLLQGIYQNAQMAGETIGHLISISEDDHFTTALHKQQQGYADIMATAKKLLEHEGENPDGLGKLEKMKTHWMVGMQTLKDSTTTHLAEMVLIGSNMGVVDALKNLRESKNESQPSRALMEDLLHYEEDNVERVKPFLGGTLEKVPPKPSSNHMG